MSDRDLVRASADFDGWDPDSIFSSSDNAINKCSPATPVKKNNSTAANLNNSRENDRDNTNVIGSKSRGVAGTFLKTASTTGSPDMFGKIMGLDEINSDQNGKQLSEDERLKMMEGERWRRLEKEALSTRAATTLRKEESRLVEQESELDVIRNKNRPQRNENVKTEKSRLIKEATDDLLEDSMDNQRRSEVQEEIRSKEGEILLLRLETERLEKIDLMRNEKERFRRNQDIEKDEERIAFLEAEAESRGLSNSLQGDEDEGDVGDDDSLIGKTETLSRNTGNNSPKSIPSSIPHSPRNVLIDFGESIDLDDSLDVRGQYPIEANSCTANSGDNTTANSGDNTTANSGESSSAVLSFSKNNDYKGNGRDQSTNSGPHLSSSISASIWERGSAARTVQSAYRGVLGRRKAAQFLLLKRRDILGDQNLKRQEKLKMHDKKQSKVLRDKGDNLLIESERERERERLRSAEEEESKQRGMELKHRSEKEAEIEKEKVREKIVSMKVQNEVENDVVVVHKARKKASNAASSVTSSRSVSPVPLYPGPQIPSQSVCMSLQSSQKVNPENSRSNRELLLLQRKQGGADRKQGSVEQNIVEMRHGRSDGMRNEEVEGGTMDSHSNTIHRTLSHSNNRIKSNHNSAYRINTKEKEKERETHKHRDDECPTDGEGGSDVDVLADSLVPIKDLQLHLAFFGTMIDGLNTEVENTDLEGSESFGLDSMYLRNKKFDTNKTPHISKEEETEIIIEIVKEKETVKIEIDKYDIEIKNDHRQPHSRLKQMILENDDRGTFDLLQDTLPEVQAKDKEKDTEKEKERIEDLKRLLKPSTSAFSIGNMAVYERDHGSEFQKKESRRNSYQSNLAQPVRKDRGPVISGGVGLFKNLEIESNMSNISSRRASTGSDGGVWSEAPGERGAGVGDLGGGGGSRLLGSAQLKQSLPPSIHDLLRMSPADACDTGRDREEKGRDREERGRDREERGREEWVGDGRGHAEEKQDEERARRIFNDKEKERDKIRSIERDRDRELSRERADVVDYGLVARKKEKEHERLLLREAEKEKSKEWEREKVKQARERLKKDAEEEEKHQQLMQQRSPQNVEPRVRPTGRNERGEGGNIDNVAPTSGGVGGGGERDVKKGALRDKEEVLRSEKERIDAVDRKKGPGRPDERGAGRESRIPKEDVDEESLLVAELLALERRQKTTLRIEDGRKRTDSGIQPPSSRDSDKARSSHGRESQLPARSGKSLARSESTPRPTRSEGVKEKVAFGPGARDVRKPDNFKSTSEAPGMLKSKSVASVSAGNRGKEKDNERDKDKDREMEREREREQGKVKKEQVAVIPTAQPDLVHLKACTPTQEEVDNEEDLQSPVSRNSSVGGNKGKMKKIMPDIQENQPAIEDGGGYLQEYRKKHADKEKEKGGLGGGGLGVAGLGGGGKVLRRRHSDMHQQGDVGREREKEREEYGGESPNVMHISSGTQSLGHKHDRRVVSKSRVAEEDSLSLPPILPASVTLEGSGRHPVDKKRNRSGGTASAPSRLRHDAASSLRATPGFEPEAPVLPNPIRVSHDYGTPNGHSPILQNSSRIGKKIPVR